MYHFTYQTTNLINGKYYIGVHSTDNLEDGYIGSGKFLKKAIKKYGKSFFNFTILCFFDTAKEAYDEEEFLLHDIWKLNENYNARNGGLGGYTGGIGWKQTDEVKKKLSDSRKGKNNPNHKGVWITPLGEFDSSRSAAKAHGISKSTLQYRCKGGGYQYYKGKRYWTKAEFKGYYFKTKDE